MADAAKKHYAWSTFNLVDKDGKRKNVVEGDEVTAATLGVSNDEFANMVAMGSVRTMPYPDTGGDSPVNHYHKQARLLAANAGVPEEE